VTVNHRYVRTTTAEAFDTMVQNVKDGRLDHEIPSHGTLVRVRRQGGLRVSREDIVAQRAIAAAARAERDAAAKAAAEAAAAIATTETK